MNVLDLSGFATFGEACGRVDNPQAYHDSKKGIPHCVSKSMLTDFARNPYNGSIVRMKGLRRFPRGSGLVPW